MLKRLPITGLEQEIVESKFHSSRVRMGKIPTQNGPWPYIGLGRVRKAMGHLK